MSAHQAPLDCSNILASRANGHCGGQDSPPSVALHNAAGLGAALAIRGRIIYIYTYRGYRSTRAIKIGGLIFLSVYVYITVPDLDVIENTLVQSAP